MSCMKKADVFVFWITQLLVQTTNCQFPILNKVLDGIDSVLVDDVDCILGADLFTPELEILSASVGFDGTIGVGTSEQDAIDLGLAWNYLVADLTECPVTGGDISVAPLTSGVAAAGVQLGYDCDKAPREMDGYPICFSWPVLPCSIQREHVQYTRTDGEVIIPNCIGPYPNQELNERHCIVMFDHFINKGLPSEESRLGMDRVDIVGDLLFVGPGGQIVSGKGLSRVAPPDETPYVSGPVFVGGRLSPLDTLGEGTAPDFSIFNSGFIPNSGVDLFGESTEGKTMYRLRLFYSGGMTPDGLTSNQPDTMFDDYLVLKFENGVEIAEYQTPVEVTPTTNVTVLGVADLGFKQDVGYDICYQEDRDNYFDVILDLKGDESVFENIKVLAFSKGKFLFNPGGPGPTPFNDTRYTAPSPADQLFAVRVDLENVHQTTFCLNRNNSWSLDPSVCEAWLGTSDLHTSPVGSLFTGPINPRNCPAGLMEQVNAAIEDAPNVTTGTLESSARKCGASIFIGGGLGVFVFMMFANWT